MSDGAIVAVVVGASALLIAVFVLAPWRSVRRDRLGNEEYYAVLAGEEPDPADPGGVPDR